VRFIQKLGIFVKNYFRVCHLRIKFAPLVLDLSILFALREIVQNPTNGDGDILSLKRLPLHDRKKRKAVT
jgi:hypothetical protein